jgi:hypothetical protein
MPEALCYFNCSGKVCESKTLMFAEGVTKKIPGWVLVYKKLKYLQGPRAGKGCSRHPWVAEVMLVGDMHTIVNLSEARGRLCLLGGSSENLAIDCRRRWLKLAAFSGTEG